MCDAFNSLVIDVLLLTVVGFCDAISFPTTLLSRLLSKKVFNRLSTEN